ncbi:hypothetical protein L5515_010295 [Caenorhabditis briggsae]|uniref:DUF19 domain-containing protein n=1 Tax=Caenorhabditis briggsae TaxID=6238 RepID=A0AAE9EQH8_CAEBR|nr:hypothetical protein L5515_010295 [Caenorhabditis briggsae]
MFNCSLIILIIIIASMISADKSSNLGKCQQEDLLLADCLEPHQNYIETSLFDVSGREISNPIFMKKFTNFTKTVATCIGTDLICDTARHYKFFVDSLSYVGENLYDPKVFKCLERITPKLQDCLNTVPISFRNLRKFQSYTLDQKKLVNCVIEKMKNDQNYITTTLSKVTGPEISDPIFISKFVEFTKTLATCIDQKPACDMTRHYKYFIDALSYVSQTIYNPKVFACLEKIERPVTQCFNFFPNYHSMKNLKIFVKSLSDLFKCISIDLRNHRECSKRTTEKLKCAFVGTWHIARKYNEFRNGSMEVVKFNPKKMMPRKMNDVICELE